MTSSGVMQESQYDPHLAPYPYSPRPYHIYHPDPGSSTGTTSTSGNVSVTSGAMCSKVIIGDLQVSIYLCK